MARTDRLVCWLAEVRFTQEPTDLGRVAVATFDDTCGNLTQIASVN